MMRGFPVTVLAVFLGLAATVGAARAQEIVCTVPKAPTIHIMPVTKPIAYDFSRSAADLTAMQAGASGTVGPYGLGADATTGGLRHDQPQVEVRVRSGYAEYPIRNAVCLWYDTIDVTISLSPQIFVAKEFGVDPVCRDAILEHERRHIAVDREVINRYAQDVGKTVSDAVNRVGAMGPYRKASDAETQKMMVDYIQNAVQANDLPMTSEMRRRQAEIDSLAEYERVSKICKNVRVR